MSKFSSFVALLLLASPMFAGPDRGRKEPWDWTDEERVAARFDPASIAERNAAY
jgi:hypothetical protein